MPVFIAGVAEAAGASGDADPAAAKPAAAAGAAKPATTTGAAKKPTTAKKQTPRKRPADTEWHGEAAPREVVPGEKVMAALLEMGGNHMNAGRYEQAIKVFTDASQRAPLEPKPLYMRGSCYQKMGKLKEAEEDFRDALSKDPKGADDQTVKVRTDLGAVLTDEGRPEEAVPLLTQAARERPDLFEANYNLGLALAALKNYPEAIDAFTKATRLKPLDPNPRAGPADAYYNLGSVLRKSGRLEDAIAPTREAVQLAPDKPHSHFNLSLLLADAKRYDEAVAEMTATIQLADGLSKSGATADDREDGRTLLQKAWWRLGIIHYQRSAPRDAVAALERAKSLEPSAEVITDLGMARRAANDFPRAEAEFRAALQLKPNLSSARLQLSTMLATNNRCPEALRELAPVPSEPAYSETISRIKGLCDYQQKMQNLRPSK